MIPGLLHHRLLGGAPGGGVLNPPSLLPLNAYHAHSSAASAQIVFSIAPDGTWHSTATGYTDESGSWYLPTTVGAGNAYEVRITPTLVSGSAGVVTNEASAWVALSAARALTIACQLLTNGSSTTVYSVKVEIRPTGGSIVSTGTFTETIDLQNGGAGGGCPTLDMFVPGGKRAGEVNAGDSLLLCDRDTGEEKWVQVTYAETMLMPCVRVRLLNGVWFDCSDSAPIGTSQGQALAPFLAGHLVRSRIGGEQVQAGVESITPIGVKAVRMITVGDQFYWMGAEPGRFVLHHNAKHSGDL